MKTLYFLYRQLPNGKYQEIGQCTSEEAFRALCKLLKPDMVGGPTTSGL